MGQILVGSPWGDRLPTSAASSLIISPVNTTTAATDATPSVFGLSSVDATLVAAMAALIAASLAFLGVTLARRQTERHWRTENRQQRIITASTQLAHESAAVRIAGVAALESLIDDYLNSARTRILW